MSLLLWIPFSQARGLDCQNTATLNQTEKLICTSPGLSKLDEKLNAAFQIRLKKTAYKLHLIQEQRNWVLQRNYIHSSCIELSEPEIDGQQYCQSQLKNLYQIRVDQLKGSYEEHNCSPAKRVKSEGVFSGDWIYEKFIQGKRWGETLSIIQQGNNLNGKWLSGGDGERVDSGTIQGASTGKSAILKSCQSISSKPCYSYKALVEDHKLSLFMCDASMKCDKNPLSILYQKNAKPCSEF